MLKLMELRQRPHISASQINQILSVCSLQYYFERVAKLPKPFVSHSLVFGTCVHKTLDSYYKGVMDGDTPDRDDHIDLFSELWKKANEEQNIQFTSRDDADSLAEKGRKVVGAFLDNRDPEERIVSVSQAFCVPVHAPDGTVAELPLVGEFDCVVETPDGTNVIVDFKTAARKWAEGQAHRNFQATVYSYAWRQLKNQRVPVRFDVVTKTKEPGYSRHLTQRSERQERRMAMLIAQAQKIIKHEAYAPNEAGNYCASCPYASACKEWGCSEPVPTALAA